MESPSAHIRTYMFQFQENGEGKWIVDSISGKTPKGYRVEQLTEWCSTCTPGDPLQPTCTKEECQFLCRHMYQCDPLCYDFQNGHLCKHVHHVHALRTITHPHTLDDENCAQSDQDTDSDIDMVSYAESRVPPQQG